MSPEIKEELDQGDAKFERDLLFYADVTHTLTGYHPNAPEAEQLGFIQTLHQPLTAAKTPERLQRIPGDSPDLLSFLLKEGKA